MKRPEHKQVMITEGFWKEQLDKIHHITVWDVLNKFEHDHEAGIMKNYEWVAEGAGGEHIGPPWYDGLICETIRGISDIIAVSYDEKLDKKIEIYAEKISQAQNMDPNGYINTYTTLICPDKRWGENGGSLIWQHETYNIGCLVEAGIHYYKATGKTKLLKCALQAADCMCSVIGETPGKNIVPAHSLAEEAMVKLYRLLKDEEALQQRLLEEYGLKTEPDRYLELAKFWMDHRGVHRDRASYPHYMGEYAQDHCRIEEQSEAVGHAVRAALMYAGLAAVGIETGEEKYLAAAKRIWDNVEQTKLHISGGIGAVHNEERFGYQYDLPNDAYLETCAGVALAFWAGEMYRAFGESRYMDAFECALYNNVLPSLSVDGTHYFYENPLVSDGSIERWSWHGCPCCPPMFLKLMGSLPDYIYAYNDEMLAVNLMIGSTAQMQVGKIRVAVEQKGCTVPWNGSSCIVLHLEETALFTVAVRKPAWAADFKAEFRGCVYGACDENGYVTITKRFQEGDEIRISMELPSMKIEAHPYVSADTGKVALMRGPLLYCLEEADNPEGVEVILGAEPLAEKEKEVCGIITVIDGRAANGRSFTAIPYYLWNNRGKGKMNVWLRQEGKDGVNGSIAEEAAGYAAHRAGKTAVDQDLSEWSGKLYRRYVDQSCCSPAGMFGEKASCRC